MGARVLRFSLHFLLFLLHNVTHWLCQLKKKKKKDERKDEKKEGRMKAKERGRKGKKGKEREGKGRKEGGREGNNRVVTPTHFAQGNVMMDAPLTTKQVSKPDKTHTHPFPSLSSMKTCLRGLQCTLPPSPQGPQSFGSGSGGAPHGRIPENQGNRKGRTRGKKALSHAQTTHARTHARAHTHMYETPTHTHTHSPAHPRNTHLGVCKLERVAHGRLVLGANKVVVP